MSESYTVVTPTHVMLTITSTINSFSSQRRFAKSLTIADLKLKLVMLTGATQSMTLELYKGKNLICNMNDDTALLGSFPVEDDMIIHYSMPRTSSHTYKAFKHCLKENCYPTIWKTSSVTDTNVKCGEFESGDIEERYKLSDNDYAKKKDNFRSFKEQNLKNLTQTKDQTMAKDQEKKDKEEEEKAATMKIGDRCQVEVLNQPKRLGTIQYVGLTDFHPGYWIGVKYDEPVGKNDGSVKGKRYFECFMKYGGFVRPSSVTVGYFPEADELDEF